VEQWGVVNQLPRTAVDVVCWDWNGTLLDDAQIALTAMNAVLAERGLPVLDDPAAYRTVFGFPVQSFYTRVGIADDDFRVAAGRYLGLFAAEVGRAPLHRGASDTLAAIGRLGVQQVLISATVIDTLEAQLAPHGIAQHFAQILGIADAYAATKADAVATWLQSSGHDPARVLMVGDTNHDEEIAVALEVSFVRFARGHQQPPDHQRHPVVHELLEVVEHVRAGSRPAG
jgi:phosphoglycolate phosphatase